MSKLLCGVQQKIATGSGAISTTVFPEGKPFMLESVELHLSAVGAAGDLVVKIDSANGPEYDVVLLTQAMATITDLYWQPEREIVLGLGDKIVVTWANAAGVTYGLNVRYIKQ